MHSIARRTAVAATGIVMVAATAGLTLTSADAAPGRAATPGHPAAPGRAAAPGHPAASAAKTGQATRSPAQRASRRDVGGARLASHGIVVNYPARHSRRLPAVPVSAYVIANAGTGQVLAAKDPHGLFPPASTLKVLTAVTMIPLLKPDATVAATRLATSVEPNIVGLVPGHRYRVADLFRALLLISANDAAVSLVQAAGSFSKGMALLNAQAHRLQAYDVVARQPNGLPAAGQVVSAYDLALIARRALSLPAFMKYDSTLAARFPVTKRKRVTLVNQNYLLTQYRGGIGGKIGWTTRAAATYIGLARRHGVTLIVTILHCTPLMEITSAERLLNWGFSMAAKVRPVGVLVPPLAATARHGSDHHSGLPGTAAGIAASASGPRGSDPSLAIGAGITAALCVAVTGGLTWLRRRACPGRRPAG